MSNTTKALALVAASFGSVAAFAGGPDITSLTDAVQVDTVNTAILAVAGVMIGVKLVQFAIRKVKGGIR